MSYPKLLLLGLVAVLQTSGPALAQFPGSSPNGLNAAMLKLFGEFTSFSSKADVRVQEKGSREPMTMTVDMSMLDGKVRMDLDISTLKSKQIPAETLAGFKAAGLARVVTVIRPERKSALLIYPTVRAYVDLPMSKEEAADMGRTYKLAKTKVGRETIDGQACDKMRVVVTADNGDKHEAVVWYASALKNFPVKMEIEQQQMTVVMQYREVKLIRPEAGQFEEPAGFAKHASVEQLMQSAMMKMLGGAKQQQP